MSPLRGFYLPRVCKPTARAVGYDMPPLTGLNIQLMQPRFAIADRIPKTSIRLH